MPTIEQCVEELGHTLPEPAAPLASYVPYQKTRNLLFISGQLPLKDGKVMTGILGDTISTQDGAYAAELCALGIVAQVKEALLGDFGRIRSLIKLEGFVAATPAFTEHPEVINGASDMMEKLFGERGRHSRTAVGVSSLPRGAAVEIAAVFSVD